MDASQPQPLRLLRSYRGYASGEVIRATPGLARQLVEIGVAAPAEPDARPLFDLRPAAERAVSTTSIETR
jgi:hypothetical protein